MKKYLLMLITIVLLTGCSNNNLTNENIIEKPQEPTVEIPEEPAYVDENPMPIGFYTLNNGTITRLGNLEYSFSLKKDITTLRVYPAFEDKLTIIGKYGVAFNNVWVSIDPDRTIKQGFNISYDLEDGTHISQNIFSPSSTQDNYDYIEIYLYDAYKHRNDSWYSHVEEREMTDTTYFTSIKLTAGSEYSKIVSPITLTTFTYDTYDDLENGVYIGKSFHTLKICDLNKTC